MHSYIVYNLGPDLVSCCLLSGNISGLCCWLTDVGHRSLSVAIHTAYCWAYHLLALLLLHGGMFCIYWDNAWMSLYSEWAHNFSNNLWPLVVVLRSVLRNDRMVAYEGFACRYKHSYTTTLTASTLVKYVFWSASARAPSTDYVCYISCVSHTPWKPPTGQQRTCYIVLPAW